MWEEMQKGFENIAARPVAAFNAGWNVLTAENKKGGQPPTSTTPATTTTPPEEEAVVERFSNGKNNDLFYILAIVLLIYCVYQNKNLNKMFKKIVK